MKMFLERTLLAMLTGCVGILVSSGLMTTPARAGVACCQLSCIGEDLNHNHGTTFLIDGKYIFCDYTNPTQMTGMMAKIKAAGIQVVIVDMTNAPQWPGGNLWSMSQTMISNISSACSSLGMQYALLIGGDAVGQSVSGLDGWAATILSSNWAPSKTYRTFGFNGDNRPLLVVFNSPGGAGLTGALNAAPDSQKTHLSQFHVVCAQVNQRQQYTSIDGWGYHGCAQSADGTVRYVSTQSSMWPYDISGTTGDPNVSTFEVDWKKIPVSAWTERVKWCSLAQCYSIYGTYDDTCDECEWGIADTSKAPLSYQYPGNDPFAYYNPVQTVLTHGLPAGTPVDNQWLVQSESLGKTANVSSMQLAYKYAQSAGNLNVVVVQTSNTSATIKSVSDSDGNAYQLAIGPTTSAGSQQWICYAPIIKASNSNGTESNTVDVTFSGQVSNADMAIYELAGVNALANAVGSSGNGTTASTSSIATNSPEILVAGASTDGTSKTYLDPGYQRGGDGNFGNNINGTEYQYVITPGNYNATMGVGGPSNTKCNWVMQLAAFYGPILALDCGGGAVGVFSADNDYSGGSTSATTSAIDTSKVTKPAPQAVYQTERKGAMSYTLGGLVAGQSYSVRLHFAEIDWTGPNKRQFNVSINGTQVLTNFDIFATAGAANTAIVQTFDAVANPTGNIVISFSNGAYDLPTISGIELNILNSHQGTAAIDSLSVFADEKAGRLTRDLTIGAANEVHLKLGQVVNILKNSEATSVISVQLPDGSTGIYQVDTSAVTAETK